MGIAGAQSPGQRSILTLLCSPKEEKDPRNTNQFQTPGFDKTSHK
jgi:hypothetical protein